MNTLKKYIASALICENLKKDKFNAIVNNLNSNSTKELLKKSIYDYLRVDSTFSKRISIPKGSDILDKIESAYNINNKVFYDDLDAAIKLFHNETNVIRQHTFANGWYELSLPNFKGNKSITIGNVNNDKVFVGRRHNIYVTIQHKKLSKKPISASGFIEYFKDLSGAMLELYSNSESFNEQNDICNIRSFKTYMISKASSLIPKTRSMNAFVRFFNEADNLKIYLSGIDRNTQNLDNLKNDVLVLIKDAFENNNFIVHERERSDFGYDFQANSNSGKELLKTSFGDVVAEILTRQILRNEDLKNSIVSQGEIKFKEYISQVEDFVSDPNNSTKIIRMILK